VPRGVPYLDAAKWGLLAVTLIGIGVLPPVERVGALLDPVRPGDQNLPSSGRAHLVHGVAVEDLAVTDREGAQPGADLEPRSRAARRGRSRLARGVNPPGRDLRRMPTLFLHLLHF
jgi:hypothetical protein